MITNLKRFKAKREEGRDRTALVESDTFIIGGVFLNGKKKHKTIFIRKFTKT